MARDGGSMLVVIGPQRLARRVEAVACRQAVLPDSVFDAVGSLMLSDVASGPVTLVLSAEHLKTAAEATVATLRSLVSELHIVVIVPAAPLASPKAPHPLAGVVDALLFEPVSDAELRRALGPAIADPSQQTSAAQRAEPPTTATTPAAPRPEAPMLRADPVSPQTAKAPDARDDSAGDVPVLPAAIDEGRSREPLGDVDLIQEIMFGPEPIGATALELVRQQTKWPDVRLVPSDGEHASGGEPVEYAGEKFGAIIAPGASPAALREWAAWLGRWLALDRSYRDFRQLTYRDDLTGAWNRRFFDAFLTQVLRMASERRRPVTVMVFDLDSFKRFNDQFGHDAGDEILKETVKLLHSVIRKGDRVCRIGGDEFAVIFADLEGPREPGSQHPESVEEIASRFQNQITMLKFPKLGTEAPGTVSISAGLATYPWDGTTPAELLRKADQLALQSKRRGKNVITFGPGAAEACKRQPSEKPLHD